MAIFTLYDINNNTVSFISTEATDQGETQPYYTFARDVKESTAGEIKQQIRPGVRFNKTYLMAVDLTKYVALRELITNQANDYYIEYDTAPCLLTGDSDIETNNNFKVSVRIEPVSQTVGEQIIYKFTMQKQSASLL